MWSVHETCVCLCVCVRVCVCCVPCSMPDMHVSRLAMRRGCVILTLDLTSMQALHGIGSGHTDNNRKQSSIVDKLVSALAEILVEGGGTEYLCHGDALTAQVRCYDAHFWHAGPSMYVAYVC